MKLFIVVSNFKKYEKNTTSIIKQLLKFFDISLSKDDSMTLFKNVSYHLFDIKDADYVVSIGGDGTFLKACRLSLIPQKRVIGIRVGRRGYLCSFDSKEIITKAKIEKLTFKKEITLKTKYGVAINDVIVGKDNFGGTIELLLSIDGLEKYRFTGDGIIVSTPIGSSGYTSSAGGRIIRKGIIITPICAINKHKPMVVSENSKIVIKNINSNYKASVYLDGIKKDTIKNNIVISKNTKTISVSIK